jgi:hypothetical protein
MFAKSGTVKDQDLVAVAQLYPHYTGETFAVKHNSAQKYWFWSNIYTIDVVLLQCFDTMESVDMNGKKRRTRYAHGSFNLAGSSNETYSRSSIELRCLVLG